MGCVEFSGAHQTTPLVVADNQSPTATGNITVTIPSTTDGATVAAEVNGTATVADQTEIYHDNAVNLEGGAASYALGGTSNAHNFSNGGGQTAAVGVHVQAATTGAAFVQSAHTQATSAATTTTATFASNVTAGNTICVSAAWANTADTLTSVTDSLGNTYTLLDNPTLGVGTLAEAASAYATNILGGACTVTMTLSPGTLSGRVLIIHEVSGVGQLDSHGAQAQLAPGTGTDAVSSGSVTTQVPGCYVFAATSDITGTATPTQGTGYTSRESFAGGASEDQVQAAAGSVSGTFTSSGGGTDSFLTVIQAFQPIADVSPTDVPQLQIIMPRVFVASHTPSWQLL